MMTPITPSPKKGPFGPTIPPHCPHGATAEAHEAFTGISGSFSETVANIRLATQAGISVHTSCVLTSQNLAQIGAVEALTERCTSCALFSKCRGGCHADAILNGAQKDPLMQQPL